MNVRPGHELDHQSPRYDKPAPSPMTAAGHALDHQSRRHRRRLGAAAATIALLATAAGCGDDSDDPGSSGGSHTVTIGYQSQTINTVTVGTVMRELGLFEEELDALPDDYDVEWEDYASGPPITAGMMAGNIDIGSMGDYPLLVNGATSQEHEDVRSEFISVTGYNLRGSLNGVVVPVDSELRTLDDLEGATTSTSFGSTAHGNFVAAMAGIGQDPDDFDLMDQDPAEGMAALQGDQVDALAQFVPFPEVALFQGFGRKLFDLGDNETPTFHAVVLRQQYADKQPEVVEAFLRAQIATTEYIHENPIEAAQLVAETTGLDVEVVYLFNGRGGIVTFDETIKDPLVDSLDEALPFLEELGSLEEIDVDEFINDSYLREAYGDGYDEAAASTENPSAVTGTDEVCDTDVDDPATASEAWFEGAEDTVPAATPTCLLMLINGSDEELRVAYVPDTSTGTKMFAATASWVHDPEASDERAQFLPFATLAAADDYVAENPGATVEDFETVLSAAG